MKNLYIFKNTEHELHQNRLLKNSINKFNVSNRSKSGYKSFETF